MNNISVEILLVANEHSETNFSGDTMTEGEGEGEGWARKGATIMS